jgi:hypothetical protein
MLYLGKQKCRLQKNGSDASQILQAVKRIEALKMNKYLHPGHFFWVAIDPRMIQVFKELHVLLSRRLSGRLAGKCKMHECRRRQNAPTSHPTGTYVASVTPPPQ